MAHLGVLGPRRAIATARRLDDLAADGRPQTLFVAVAAEAAIVVLDSQRGRSAQERAFALGHSRAHFGQSAHNWSPAVALDVVPAPIDWSNLARFRALAALVQAEAAAREIRIVWGGDWVGLRDMPHYELAPWREWAAKSIPFAG
ncbi:MAG: M15 family metallopeptidase [Devosia sp.]